MSEQTLSVRFFARLREEFDLAAKWQIAAYAGEPERHRAAIARLGQQFSIVTAGTSLLVLDDIADYVRYDIAPPADLRADVARLQAEQGKRREASRSERLDAVANIFADRLAWWKTSFPKDRPAATKIRRRSESVDCWRTALCSAPPREQGFSPGRNKSFWTLATPCWIAIWR